MTHPLLDEAPEEKLRKSDALANIFIIRKGSFREVVEACDAPKEELEKYDAKVKELFEKEDDLIALNKNMNMIWDDLYTILEEVVEKRERLEKEYHL